MRKAKSQACLKMVDAINSVPSQQCTVVLKDALTHPSVIKNTKKIAVKVVEPKNNLHNYATLNLIKTKKMLNRALTTNKKRGRSTDDKASYVETVLSTITESPDAPTQHKINKHKII